MREIIFDIRKKKTFFHVKEILNKINNLSLL